MSINEFDKDRAFTKFPAIGQPPQPDNPIVTATLAAERATARAGRLTGDTSWLFDHANNPDLWEIANETMQHMHSQYGDFMAGVWGDAVFLYYPGAEDFRVYSSDIERFAYMLNYHSQNGCDIRMAPGRCGEGTVFLPLQRGPFIVVFEVCESCDAWARETAEHNFKFRIIAAQAKLPPGARVVPGSPRSPRP